MALDTNEQKLIDKLVEALTLLRADSKDIEMVSKATKVDDDFLAETGKIFDGTDACDVCRHAFHSWRNTLDDDTVISFIDDWVKWKGANAGSEGEAPVIQMKKRK
jgi:hypothetical protein